MIDNELINITEDLIIEILNKNNYEIINEKGNLFKEWTQHTKKAREEGYIIQGRSEYKDSDRLHSFIIFKKGVDDPIWENTFSVEEMKRKKRIDSISDIINGDI